jgi:hypothetical protein
MKLWDVFEVGFSLDDRDDVSAVEPGFCGSDPSLDTNEGLTVLVHPLTHPKADGAELKVRLGFGTSLP